MSKARSNVRNFGRRGQNYKVSSSSRMLSDLRSVTSGSSAVTIATGPSVTSDADVKYVLVYQKDAKYEKPSFAK
ncbi:hypothetical protein PaeBR_05265 [Paenibacillus sp. BR2-3]|uniref:hypothetical protein n=1 Tax=Paenibacillus sp. BR2-3 TaxID=3048494 RepID=UPI0039777D9D